MRKQNKRFNFLTPKPKVSFESVYKKELWDDFSRTCKYLICLAVKHTLEEGGKSVCINIGGLVAVDVFEPILSDIAAAKEPENFSKELSDTVNEIVKGLYLRLYGIKRKSRK